MITSIENKREQKQQIQTDYQIVFVWISIDWNSIW